MDYFICIETSGDVCSVALCSYSGEIITRECWEKNSHSRYLTVELEKLFSEFIEDKEKQILAIAVSQGPGSYTGLRIGVSTAKGLAYALDKPLIAIDTLAVMLENLKQNHSGIVEKADYFVPMIDARRMEVYYKIFDKTSRELSGADNLVLDESSFSDILSQGKVVFFGSGADKFSKVLHNSNAVFVRDIVPLAKYMYQLTKERFDAKLYEDVAYFEPFYLKPFIPTTKPKDLLGNA